MNEYRLYNGDCVDKLKELPDNSVDSIVTDPPYGLSKEPDMIEVLTHWMNGESYSHNHKGFMGKEWDSFVPSPNIWKECLRVLKPGGHMIAFFGTRTYDIGTLSIRIAGFEIRDQLAWVFGTGFPKSMNISKAIDANLLTGNSDSKSIKDVNVNLRDGPTSIRQTTTNGHSGFVGSKTEGSSIKSDAPKTDEAKHWEGWGTALKPAYEPIVLARKPLIGTVAKNVLEYGTGGINIDGSRIETSESKPRDHEMSQAKSYSKSGSVSFTSDAGKFIGGDPKGRFPSNLIHDGSDEVVDLFPYSKSGALTSDQQAKGGYAGSGSGIIYGTASRGGTSEYGGSEGSASRFFYCAKASSGDRDEGLGEFNSKQASGLPLRSKDKKSVGAGLDGTKTFRETTRKNVHPTVKPVSLMQHLVRMITPPNGTVLDPFMGSGSTGKAAMYEGFKFIGIEMDKSYMEIAEARIKFAMHNKDEVQLKTVAKSPPLVYDDSNDNLGKFL